MILTITSFSGGLFSFDYIHMFWMSRVGSNFEYPPMSDADLGVVVATPNQYYGAVVAIPDRAAHRASSYFRDNLASDDRAVGRDSIAWVLSKRSSELYHLLNDPVFEFMLSWSTRWKERVKSSHSNAGYKVNLGE